MHTINGIKSDLSQEDLIDETMRLVRGEKEGLEWNQEFYASPCGTAFCVAGSAMHHAGYMPAYGLELGPDVGSYWTRPEGNTVHEVNDSAQDLLGLQELEPGYLFDYDRTKGEVLDCLELMKKGQRVSSYPGFKRWLMG